MALYAFSGNNAMRYVDPNGLCIFGTGICDEVLPTGKAEGLATDRAESGEGNSTLTEVGDVIASYLALFPGVFQLPGLIDGIINIDKLPGAIRDAYNEGGWLGVADLFFPGDDMIEEFAAAKDALARGDVQGFLEHSVAGLQHGQNLAALVYGLRSFFAARGGSFGRNTVGAAERAIPKFTRAMKSKAEIIAKGKAIDKVGTLVEKFGGKANKWKKMKTWTPDGSEIHWYEHPGIGKVGQKWAGFPDPF